MFNYGFINEFGLADSCPKGLHPCGIGSTIKFFVLNTMCILLSGTVPTSIAGCMVFKKNKDTGTSRSIIS